MRYHYAIVVYNQSHLKMHGHAAVMHDITFQRTNRVRQVSRWSQSVQIGLTSGVAKFDAS